MPPSRPVAAPEDFTEDQARLFRACQRTLREAGSWRDVDAPVLVLFCMAVNNAQALRLAAQRQPIIQGKDGPRVHPAISAAAECEARAVALSDALLLSASARERAMAKPSRPGSGQRKLLKAI